MQMIKKLFLLAIITGCSVSVYKDVNITELEYPDSLEVVRRAEWGWQPFEYVIDEHDIDKITIHHGGVEFSADKDVKEYLKGLQSWSRSEKEWIDIPYHFVIDLDGNIYEARPINYPGATNTNYDTRGHALVNVVGNYEVQALSEEQLDSVIKLCAYLSDRFNLAPELIKGHKDYSDQTVCPGKDLYKYLQDGTIVKRVMELVID